MAERIAAVEDYLTCAVCLETFKEPVTLGCNHSFCSSCLHIYWDQNHTRKCPICRRKSSTDNPIVNFALKKLCASFTGKPAGACSSHPEVPALFCMDEARALCPVCEFSLHTQHTVVPVEQAEKGLKQKLQTQLQSLMKQRGDLLSLEQAYRDIQQHSARQADDCERHIRAEFNRFYRFLKEEEELRLTALRQEQSRQAQAMAPELDKLRETLASLDQSIRELQTQLQRKTEDFMNSYKPIQTQDIQSVQIGPGLLLNQAGLLNNLAFHVWKKMRNIVQFSPVILDPNTAHHGLCLSDDLTAVRQAPSLSPAPDNPERFNEYAFVVGSEGFSSGTHLWDVEVGDYPHWIVGVTKETARRKGDTSLTPQTGFWCLYLLNEEYLTTNDTLNEKLYIKNRPEKIRVQLDYIMGTVSFFDPRDMTLIYTYKDTFTEKLFPVFNVGPANTECQSKGIRICPAQEECLTLPILV